MFCHTRLYCETNRWSQESWTASFTQLNTYLFESEFDIRMLYPQLIFFKFHLIHLRQLFLVFFLLRCMEKSIKEITLFSYIINKMTFYAPNFMKKVQGLTFKVDHFKILNLWKNYWRTLFFSHKLVGKRIKETARFYHIRPYKHDKKISH